MSKKPKEKLRRGVIDARELRTLLQQEEWKLDRTKGSHEVWIKRERTFVLATHSKDLKPYQMMKQAREVLRMLEVNDHEKK